MNSEPLLIAENIHKYFTKPTHLHILNDISLIVYPKQKIAILGKSGEGKSTLLHILGTIESPTHGKLIIKGQRVHRDPCTLRNHTLGFVFQSFHLLNEQTVLENVLMPMKIARNNTKAGSLSYERAVELIDQVRLSNRIHHTCNTLSGGEKQRVAIARAFANDPDIILADEPTGNLDHKSAQEIQNLLFEFTKSHEKALIVVTHNEELASLCDVRYKLENGYLQKIF